MTGAQPINTATERVDSVEWTPAQARWVKRSAADRYTIDQVLEDDSLLTTPGISVFIFPEPAKVESLEKEPGPHPLRERLSKRFQVPPLFWTKCAWDSNGFFGSRENPLGGRTDIQRSYSSHSRFLIKWVTGPEAILDKAAAKSLPRDKLSRSLTFLDDIEYGWEFHGIYTLWIEQKLPDGTLSQKQIILCFDFEDMIRQSTLEAFARSYDASQLMTTPMGSLSILVTPIIDQFDRRLWGFRPFVRSLEKDRVDLGHESEDSDRKALQARYSALSKRYKRMHELQRHVIHACETLKVGTATLAAMSSQHDRHGHGIPKGPAQVDAENVGSAFRFATNFLENLQYRAKSFEERLSNEIRLVFNTVAANNTAMLNTQMAELHEQNKRSSSILEQMEKQSQQSSKVLSLMKDQSDASSRIATIVAAATILFLPGSFVSSFFGTNFFVITQPTDGTAPQFTFVPQLWIFFVITIPVTLAIYAFWCKQTIWRILKTGRLYATKAVDEDEPTSNGKHV